MGGIVVGGMVAVALLALAIGLGRALLRESGDPQAATDDLVGALGTVVATIPGDGSGAVTIAHTDQWLRVQARADAPIPAGATVIVLDVRSPTEVLVAESGF